MKRGLIILLRKNLSSSAVRLDCIRLLPLILVDGLLYVDGVSEGQFEQVLQQG
jgi:hypothetical protein